MLDLKFDEDYEEAVLEVEKVLGKQGRILPHGRDIMIDAKLTGPNGAILWYGDIDKKEDGSKISVLAAKLGFGLGAKSEFSNETQLYPILVSFEF